MDETEAKPDDAEPAANREYVWFAIALLCMIGLLVLQTQS
jgi:hypothetical protein